MDRYENAATGAVPHAPELPPDPECMTAPALRGRQAALGLIDTMLPGREGANARWHYEEGLFLLATRRAGTVWDRNDLADRVDGTVLSLLDPDPEHPVRGYRVEEFNLDQINPGRNLFPFLEAGRVPAGEKSGSSLLAEAALKKLRSQIYSQPRTHSGGFWHKRIYPQQMWLDGLYMAGPFLAEYARVYREPDLVRELVFQFTLAERGTRNPATGLLHHGWDESRTQAWADPVTGRSPHVWGRSVGWYLMALVDCLSLLPRTSPEAETLAFILSSTARGMLPYQDRDTGLWRQLVEHVDHPGNYFEASVSAMLAYSFLAAVRLGFLPAKPYRDSAIRAFCGCLDHFLVTDTEGKVHYRGTCAVAGLGGTPYRDGSIAYYLSEPVRDDDCKGAGPFILAATELWLDSAPQGESS